MALAVLHPLPRHRFEPVAGAAVDDLQMPGRTDRPAHAATCTTVVVVCSTLCSLTVADNPI